MPALHRALVALDAAGYPRVLATDSAMIASEFEHCGTDAVEIGIVSAKDIGPGLWLWEGKVTARDQRGYEDLYPEWVMDFEGAAARLELFDERLPDLFAMAPPEPIIEEDDRESPGV
jgi:hypothetical protein